MSQTAQCFRPCRLSIPMGQSSFANIKQATHWRNIGGFGIRIDVTLLMYKQRVCNGVDLAPRDGTRDIVRYRPKNALSKLHGFGTEQVNQCETDGEHVSVH